MLSAMAQIALAQAQDVLDQAPFARWWDLTAHSTLSYVWPATG